MRRFFLYSLLGVLLLVLVTVLGGSAVWWLAGFGDKLAIDGKAQRTGAPVATIGASWDSYGGDPGGNRYSALTQITPANVTTLKPAWTLRTGAYAGREALMSKSSTQVTPILVGDKLILCTPFDEVIAADPGTGRILWRFDPKVKADAAIRRTYICRGVTQWRDPGKAAGAICATSIFLGTQDARLFAIDADSGKPCPGFGANGEVKAGPDMPLRPNEEFQFNSAPAVVGDVVVLGSALSDNVRSVAPRGTVRAFSARTGAPAWTFEPYADPDHKSGAANAWAPLSVDQQRGLVFIPTSSASTDFYGANRPGDNRNADSVVALDGRTGKLVWAFQTVHHNVWDYDVPAQPGLNTVWSGGAAHDVVSVTTKTGLVFVLDRDTGKPFLPIEERPVPQGGVAGEILSPTQPFPVRTPPIVPSKIEPGDGFGLTLWDRMACNRRIAALRNDGLFTPATEQGTLTRPFSGGGGNWGSSAFDPARNLLVVNMSNLTHAITLTRKTPGMKATPPKSAGHLTGFAEMDGTPYSLTRELMMSPLGVPCNQPPWGVIAGIDLASGKIVWRHRFGTTEDLTGIALDFGTPNIGGPMITGGGLIFIGAAQDNYLRALDVETGRELWKGRLPAGGQATPMTYEWHGRQYVVIAAGGHAGLSTTQGDYVLAFSLPG